MCQMTNMKNEENKGLVRKKATQTQSVGGHRPLQWRGNEVGMSLSPRAANKMS